jgi:hypothetical protein
LGGKHEEEGQDGGVRSEEEEIMEESIQRKEGARVRG